MGTLVSYPEFHSRRAAKAQALGRLFCYYGRAQAVLDLQQSVMAFAPPEYDDGVDAHIESLRRKNVSTGPTCITSRVRSVLDRLFPDNQND